MNDVIDGLTIDRVDLIDEDFAISFFRKFLQKVLIIFLEYMTAKKNSQISFASE